MGFLLQPQKSCAKNSKIMLIESGWGSYLRSHACGRNPSTCNVLWAPKSMLLNSFLFFFFHLRIFWCGPFLKSLFNLLQYCFCFTLWFFVSKAWGILAHWPGSKPLSPVLEGEVLTTGPPVVKTCSLTFDVHKNHLEMVLKCRVWLADLRENLRFCISNQLPDNAKADGLGSILRAARLDSLMKQPTTEVPTCFRQINLNIYSIPWTSKSSWQKKERTYGSPALSELGVRETGFQFLQKLESLLSLTYYQKLETVETTIPRTMENLQTETILILREIKE